MLKKLISMLLIGLVMNLAVVTTFAETKAEKEVKFAEKVKANVTKLGVGKNAKVQVKLKDGTKLKGYVSQINESSFAVIDHKTGEATEVPYRNAKQVKGNNWSTGVTIAVVIVIVLVIAAIVGATSPD
jgi:small nuclear ribonucleoprotein (snRNP)-like protein